MGEEVHMIYIGIQWTASLFYLEGIESNGHCSRDIDYHLPYILHDLASMHVFRETFPSHQAGTGAGAGAGASWMCRAALFIWFSTYLPNKAHPYQGCVSSGCCDRYLPTDYPYLGTHLTHSPTYLIDTVQV